MRNAKIFGMLGLIGGVLLGMGGADASEFVVLSSNAKGISAGNVIPDGKAIKVPPRRRVVMVNELGRTVSVTGPFDGVPDGGGGAGGGKKFVAALASLVRSTQEDAKSVGAIRAAGITTEHQAMMINISETGDYCISKDGRPDLTRYKSETGSNATVVAIENGQSHKFDWTKGQAHVAWPKEIPAKDKGRYLIQQEGKDTKTLITLHHVTGTHETQTHRALAMAEFGCLEQAKMLLALVRRQAR